MNLQIYSLYLYVTEIQQAIYNKYYINAKMPSPLIFVTQEIVI